LEIVKSAAVYLALALGLMGLPAFAAPGPFQLYGNGTCVSYVAVISLSWTPSSDATSYIVFRDGSQYATVTKPAEYWRYDDTAVVAGGASHTYFVRASGDGPVTTDSNTVTVTPWPTSCAQRPPEPFSITGAAYCDPGDPTRAMAPGITVDWRPAPGASSYDVYQNGVLFDSFGGNGSLYTLRITGAVLQGQTRSYYVIAKNSGGTSTSNTVTVTVPSGICTASPPVPVLSATALCNSSTARPSVSLEWTGVTGVSGWKVFRDGTLLYAAPTRSFIDTNVEPGQVYTYNVSTNGLSAPLSNTVTVAVSAATCAPGPFTATPFLFCDGGVSTAVSVTWTASVNATSYTLLRGTTTIASGLTGLGYYDTSVAEGGAYTYRVIAVNSVSTTSTAPMSIAVNEEQCPPGSFAVSAEAICPAAVPAVHVSWSPSARAASYVVSRNGIAVSAVLPASTMTYIDAPPRGSYGYTVTATNAAGTRPAEGGAQLFLTESNCPGAPGDFDAVGSVFCSGGAPIVRLQWAAAAGAASYAISRDGVDVTTLSALVTSYDDTHVLYDQQYHYLIVASNAAGKKTSAVTITPWVGSCPPGDFTLSATTACTPPITLNWTATPNNVLTYSIYRNHAILTSVDKDTLRYADNSAQPGNAYTYFVRANGLSGISLSNEVTANADVSLCDAHTSDLTALDIALSAVSGRAGETITVGITAENHGNALAAATTARIRFGRGVSMSQSDSVLAVIGLPALASGAAFQQRYNVILPTVSAGTYTLFLSIDEEHVSSDTRLDNNVKASATFKLMDMIPPRRRAATH
jgi:fibronectin type 3 domain-containing protein